MLVVIQCVSPRFVTTRTLALFDVKRGTNRTTSPLPRTHVYMPVRAYFKLLTNFNINENCQFRACSNKCCATCCTPSNLSRPCSCYQIREIFLHFCSKIWFLRILMKYISMAWTKIWVYSETLFIMINSLPKNSTESRLIRNFNKTWIY